ncbi:DUF429 domain-containing protein [Amantichitinum ursilacus]|uniref:DUF429 domain-containing protein n=1 Tax=Amantichitinum ursilacus TaxID=857265 RepID=A0A0N1JTG0_9NEIS|nr:DUF429 domain-containing protein [Amantichitinum ursilacus]KPC54170.1 hypothetical protein WG78_05955 [Amantichitinum ursilacus]
MQHRVAGIDVGGDKKKCNLVILQGDQVLLSVGKQTPADLRRHCLEYEVMAVGVDAPCQWRLGDAGRVAEAMLAKQRISSFSTPTRAQALASLSGFYGWMFNGEAVYQALADDFALLETPAWNGQRICFETFPHAIVCAFLGREVACARRKSTQRKQLLQTLGIATATLKSVDARDAALCAVTARYLLQGQARAYGDALGGHIHVPKLDQHIVMAS